MFEGWGDFYLLTGSAAAALIGLLFVVVTLTQNRERSSAQRGTALYMTPTVFNFGMIVVLSGLALAPRLTNETVGWSVAIGALAGLGYAGTVSVRLKLGHAPEPPHWSDFWCYGALPFALYLLLLATAFPLGGGRALALYAMALLVMGLLLSGVRNAWDLVTWLAPRSGGA
jgi:hypothetical protein